ncbi:hypothetical protein [Stenotrophomonas sp. Iso1]|uniref:hypothetical protein n=1 Tax=Stenotrophomonas sp. Iso1 TaxID=2977283 RepID=UPI0022B7D013|nr:hypothetical protein [Stenotrophomonas sp. Iso1]
MSHDDSRVIALPPPPTPAVVLDDPLAVASYGAGLLAMVEQRASAAGDGHAAARLVAEMDNIHQAMRAHDTGAIRRSVGLLGRLLGRDVEVQAQAERLAGQLDICLLRADGIVTEVQGALPVHQQQAVLAAEAVSAIDAWAEAGERVLQDAVAQAGAADSTLTVAALQRRLHHLRGVARLRALEASQLQLLHAQSVELLERYQRIRDVLLPLWRQQVLATKAAGMSARLVTAADTQTRILAEVEAMQARLR